MKCPDCGADMEIIHDFGEKVWQCPECFTQVGA